MSYLAWLVPIALGMGLAGLAAFLWSLKDRQYDDLDGAAERVLLTSGNDAPLKDHALGNGRLPGDASEVDQEQWRHP